MKHVYTNHAYNHFTFNTYLDRDFERDADFEWAPDLERLLRRLRLRVLRRLCDLHEKT